MVDHDRTYNVSITLRNSQIKKVEKYLSKTKRFSSVSNFYQYLTDNYFDKNDDWKNKFKNFMAYLGYPLIVMTIMLFLAKKADNLSKLLINRGFLFVDLSYLANMIYLIGFIFLGVLIFNVGILYIKARKEK